MSNRQFTWDDKARVLVRPAGHPIPMSRGSLAYCVRAAIEIDDAHPSPDKVEIAHASDGLIQMDEIRRMRADPSFPHEEVTIEDMEKGTIG